MLAKILLANINEVNIELYICEISDQPLNLAKTHFCVLAGKASSASYLQTALSFVSSNQHF